MDTGRIGLRLGIKIGVRMRRSNGLSSEHIYITLDTHEFIVANSIIPLQVARLWLGLTDGQVASKRRKLIALRQHPYNSSELLL